VEASALQAPLTLGRISVSVPLLRLRSDDQLVELFRAGNDDAFRVIHDRYRQRLFAYVRQMLAGSRQDAEDAMQDVFIRAYSALRENRRPMSLRAWLYRVAHNRCIDQLRRPVPIPSEMFDVSRQPLRDPLLETERREDLRRLVADVRELPEQQRSALLMREMQGMSYAELSGALGVSIPAVKSLLVRARMGLVEAAEARDTACLDIQEDLVGSFDRGVRMSGRVRRHVRECVGCREYRTQLRAVRHGFDSLTPSNYMGLLAKLGLGGSGAAAGTSAAGSGGSVAILGGGSLVAATATKVAALVCCAAVLTGGGLSVPRVLSLVHHGRVAGGRSSSSDPVVSTAPVAIAPLIHPLAPAPGVVSASASHARHHSSTPPVVNSAPISDPGSYGGATYSATTAPKAGTTSTTTSTSNQQSTSGSATVPTVAGTTSGLLPASGAGTSGEPSSSSGSPSSSSSSGTGSSSTGQTSDSSSTTASSSSTASGSSSGGSTGTGTGSGTSPSGSGSTGSGSGTTGS
jgi:RNA polymerase sigma factor (sigma-70 family)